MDHDHDAITIFVNNTEYQTEKGEMTGAEIKALASVPEDYELFEVRGDQTLPVGNEQAVKLHNKMHFRAIPARYVRRVDVSVPVKLQRELDSLDNRYGKEVVEESDFVDIVLKDFELGEGFSVIRTELLIRVPKTYPDAGPDMFWTNPEVKLSSGQVPQAAESIENYLGRPWRRFSWHRKCWNPVVDNLSGTIEFIRKRLREKK